MSEPIEPSQIERFRDAIAGRLVLWFDDSKLSQIQEVLSKRATRRKLSTALYLERLTSERGLGELRELAALLTVPETYFFRNMAQLRACLEVAVPAALQSGARATGLRILCAGCAFGEEPYTLAMLLREHHP